jgi:hypothetical protein
LEWRKKCQKDLGFCCCCRCCAEGPIDEFANLAFNIWCNITKYPKSVQRSVARNAVVEEKKVEEERERDLLLVQSSNSGCSNIIFFSD